MCSALALVVSAVASLNIALPDLATDLSASQTDLQWIVDGYAVVFAGLLLPAGAIGDRFGRRRALLVGLAVFGLAYTVGALATAPATVVAARAAAGVGAALIMPATLSILTAVYPPEERDQAVSVWAGVAGAGAVLGLLISGVLVEVAGWKWVFVANGGWAFLALMAAVKFVPAMERDSAAALDPVGAVLSASGLAALVLAVVEGPHRGWTDGLVLAGLAGGAVLLVTFVLWERSRLEPLLDPRLFALRGFSAGTAALTLQFFAMFGFFFVILQFAQLVLGYSPLQAASAMVPMALILIAGARGVAPRIAGRVGIRIPMATGLLLMAGGLTVLSTLGVGSGYWHLLAGLVLLGAGAGLSTAPATTAIVSALPSAKQGVASAVNDTAREVGGALGIAVLGSVLADSYASGMEGAVDGIPSAAGEAATESLAAALAVSERLGRPELAQAAQAAFADGLGAAFLLGAGALLVAAGWVLARAPRGLVRSALSDAGEPVTNEGVPTRRSRRTTAARRSGRASGSSAEPPVPGSRRVRG